MAKRKYSASQINRLRELRRKHGLGEFRTGIIKKPKRARSNIMAKRKSYRHSSSGMMGGLGKPLTAGVIYGVAQPFVSDFLRKFNIGVQDELMQIVAAIVLKNVVKNDIVNNYANAAIIVNTASLARGFSSGMGFGATNASTASTTNGGSQYILA